jgi:hypothetical protein
VLGVVGGQGRLALGHGVVLVVSPSFLAPTHKTTIEESSNATTTVLWQYSDGEEGVDNLKC